MCRKLLLRERNAEVIQQNPELLLQRLHRLSQVIFGGFFGGGGEQPATPMPKHNNWRLFKEAQHLDHISNVIAIEAAVAAEQNSVLLADFHLGRQ